MVVLAPAIALVGAAAGEVSPGFGPFARRWLGAVCIGAWALGAMFLGGHAAAWTPTLLAPAVLCVGLALAWRRLRSPAFPPAFRLAPRGGTEGGRTAA